MELNFREKKNENQIQNFSEYKKVAKLVVNIVR